MNLTPYLSGNFDPGLVPRQAKGWTLHRRESTFELRASGGRRSTRCNATAALVWELIDGHRDLESICGLIERAYDLPSGESKEQVVGVLDALSSLGAIEVPEAGGSPVHSIITWDCCFREAFHLMRALCEVDYDLQKVEVIHVEQRSRQTADNWAQRSGVLSAGQIADQVSDRLPVRVLYLDEPDEEPYHPGRLLNAGISVARGTIVSTMDADVLVPREFLLELDRLHRGGDAVGTIFRHQAPRPLGVTMENWNQQSLDYRSVLDICPSRHTPIPSHVSNKAPLISAKRCHWHAIGGYDSHRLFSTAYTLFGRDVALRFRLLLGDVERVLPVPSVHPWHPTEVNRGSEMFQVLFDVQQQALHWSSRNRAFDVRSRKQMNDELYAMHQSSLDEAISISEEQMRRGTEATRAVAQ